MTKIRDMAKISPLKTPIKKVTPVITQTRPRGNPNNPGFKQWLAERHTAQVSLQEILGAALLEQTQPVTIQELMHYLKVEANITLPDYRFRYALDQLVATKRFAMRLETNAERTLRADGKAISPKPALLFSVGTSVPARSEVNAVEGYSLTDLRASAGIPKPRKSSNIVVDLHTLHEKGEVKASDKARHPSSREATVINGSNNSALEFLIDKIVQERTKDLQAQLDAANAKLAQFKKLLS